MGRAWLSVWDLASLGSAQGTGCVPFTRWQDELIEQVWFCADSSRAGTGAFQEFSVHSQFNIAHTPPNLTDEQAATLGSGLVTAGVALFRTLRLDIESFSPEPSSCNGQWILIAGGAGITGVYLIQLAHHLGYRVICAASPVNFEYLRQLGAEAVVDRWAGQEDIVRQIRKVTNDEVGLRDAWNLR